MPAEGLCECQPSSFGEDSVDLSHCPRQIGCVMKHSATHDGIEAAVREGERFCGRTYRSKIASQHLGNDVKADDGIETALDRPRQPPLTATKIKRGRPLKVVNGSEQLVLRGVD